MAAIRTCSSWRLGTDGGGAGGSDGDADDNNDADDDDEINVTDDGSGDGDSGRGSEQKGAQQRDAGWPLPFLGGDAGCLAVSVDGASGNVVLRAAHSTPSMAWGYQTSTGRKKFEILRSGESSFNECAVVFSGLVGVA
jgi:hypothetical protein